MRKGLRFALLAIALVWGVSMAGAASAQVDVEATFTPDVAYPGDQVSFFASVENTGTEADSYTIEVTVEFDGHVFGPVTGHLDLAAGEAMSIELTLMVPPGAPFAEYTVTITATGAYGSDTAVATLEVLEGMAAMPADEVSTGEYWLNKVGAAFNAVEPESKAVSWGQVKALFQ